MASTPVIKKRVPASRSTVATKYAMAVSGLIMVSYLILHMYGNLKVFAGQQKFDEYSHHIRTFGEPILPYEGLLWIIRVALVASIVVHTWAAITLWRRNRAASGYQGGKRYHTSKGARGFQRSYASFTLRWGGIIIILFVVYHLLHLTANVVAPGGASDSPYERVVNGFEIWWVTVSYTIAVLAVGLHLWHGIWSALTTLGQNYSSTRLRSRLTPLSWFVSAVITIGFLLPPWAILLGITG
ncbi:succinate dehydrogenase cytochrome b subunit [Aeromicrobium camelliae]|uniref:Succinate dehydrogenase cytochrome b subunit n=1 Tax=Aeromicrobium camelliae TaxID=1538144 RepID=A0A3N6ZMP8_9ACTN|nr:succinate dehydrogenase cytochrome b subunit [Aeromicrobium camelliae]RQN08317.1 succinate dehydrogenase cytochrome b subunit [Aeromicrobium camelliae]